MELLIFLKFQQKKFCFLLMYIYILDALCKAHLSHFNRCRKRSSWLAFSQLLYNMWNVRSQFLALALFQHHMLYDGQKGQAPSFSFHIMCSNFPVTFFSCFSATRATSDIWSMKKNNTEMHFKSSARINYFVLMLMKLLSDCISTFSDEYQLALHIIELSFVDHGCIFHVLCSPFQEDAHTCHFLYCPRSNYAPKYALMSILVMGNYFPPCASVCAQV